MKHSRATIVLFTFGATFGAGQTRLCGALDASASTQYNRIFNIFYPNYGCSPSNSTGIEVTTSCSLTVLSMCRRVILKGRCADSDTQTCQPVCATARPVICPAR
ncbi:hypothetical protein EDB86DRAFT_12919 [Lactarius hatsudake]|nr:hypothetical protein EDB86DRAFT_12919 [Lactarius hatsudake]